MIDASFPRPPLPPGSPTLPDPDLSHLEQRLAEQAEAYGLVDVGYRHVDSPLGRLLVAATEAGVVRVAFEDEADDAVLGELATAVSPRVLPAPRRLDPAARQLDDYFTGRRTRFEVPVDLRLLHGFRRDVVDALPGIGYGVTVTYGELAGRLGRPGAARAVGSGCAHNPVPVIVPCHRVLPAGGGVGGYRGGPHAKRLLLELESRHAHHAGSPEHPHAPVTAAPEETREHSPA